MVSHQQQRGGRAKAKRHTDRLAHRRGEGDWPLRRSRRELAGASWRLA